MLTAQALTYQVNGKTLLNNVDLQLAHGEIFALVGANGAGKSTLLRLLGGELTPSSGEIQLEGHPLGSYSRRQLALKRAFMSPREMVSFDFSVYEVVMLGRHPHIQRTETPRDKAIVEATLIRTEASHLSERFFNTLSSGEQARVSFARVLAQATPLLLLDEPTSTLDLRHQQLLMMIAQQLTQQGATVVVIVHDLNLAATYADRVGMLKAGEWVAVGTPNEVFTPENLLTAFDLPTVIMPHPHHNRPLIVPLPLEAR